MQSQKWNMQMKLGNKNMERKNSEFSQKIISRLSILRQDKDHPNRKRPEEFTKPKRTTENRKYLS